MQSAFTGNVFSGISGFSGTSGSGASGFSGFSGYSGPSGISGTSGTSGTSGVSGFSASGGTSNSRGTIDGLTLSPSIIIDPFNNIDISPGSCIDNDNSVTMTLPNVFTKRLNGAWVAGTFSGGLFSGTKAVSTWYHVFLIRKTSDGTIDAGFDTSLSAANIPSGYSKYRRLGSIRTDSSGNIIQFTQTGSAFLWASAIADVTSTTQSTTAVLYTLTVPTGVKVEALLSSVTLSSAGTAAIWYTSPDQTDEAPTLASPYRGNQTAVNAVVAGYDDFYVRTNTSAQIRVRSSVLLTNLDIRTRGWVDDRGKDVGDTDITDAWDWGRNDFGQLGDNSTTNRSSPVSVVGLHSFVRIATSLSHDLGLKNNGTCWSWGRVASQTAGIGGQLGDNQITANRSSPVSVVGAHSFWIISAHHNYRGGLSAGLKLVDGAAWTWGVNAYGSIGDNTVSNRSSPVSVVGAHSFNKICCGYYAMIALKTNNGTVWTWGRNTFGALGDNSVTNRSSPVSVVGAHSFIDAVMGKANNIALKADGSAWCWGYNSFGQLGQNDIANRSSPVSVIGAHSFVQVSCGHVESFGLKSDGSLWAWGNNTGGSVGDGTVNNRSSPVSVIGGHSFVRTSGGTTGFGLKSDGSLWGWGSGANGYIGDGTTNNRTSPVSVLGAFSFRNIPFSNYRAFGGIVGS